MLYCHKMSYSPPEPYGFSHLLGSFLSFPFSLCLFINTSSRLQCSGLGQSMRLRMGETTKTQISLCFIPVSLRRSVCSGPEVCDCTVCLRMHNCGNCFRVKLVNKQSLSSTVQVYLTSNGQLLSFVSCGSTKVIQRLHQVIWMEEKL